MKIIKWLFVFLFQCTITWAQQPDYLLKENSVWTFGSGAIGQQHGAGMNFNIGSSSPSPIVSSTGGFGEAQASVCDANGQLLFYTEGTYVFDHNNNQMLHGDSLVGDPAMLPFENLALGNLAVSTTASTAQGAVIVPVVGNHNQYYIFSLTSYESDSGSTYIVPHVSHGHGSELYYSIIDKTLHNGLGDVVTTSRGIFLDSNLNESMVAVAGTNCDIWLLVHSFDGAIIKAYNINANGVNPVPVISSCGTVFLDYAAAGAMKISPDRHKLAVCIDALNGGADICDFDPATGIASNATPAGTYGEVYQACFSPDGSQVYFQTGFQNSLLQYNLVTQTLTEINNNVSYSDLQIGIDGKIYFQDDGTHIGCIEFPNLTGAACDVINHVVHIPTGTSMYIGLHSLYVKPLVDTIAFSHDTGLCAQSVNLTLQGPAGYDSYLWSTGSTDTSITVQTINYYIVQSNSICVTRFDTFKVKNVNPEFTLGPDTTYCSVKPITLHVPVFNAIYLWQDGSMDSTYTVVQSGVYSVQINELGCLYSDTINIGFINVQQNLGDDTTLCTNGQGIQLTLTANVPEGASVAWSDGSTGTSIIADTGSYWVHVTDSVCQGADTININSLNINVQQDLGNDTTICNGQQIKLEANVPEEASVIWSNGSTSTSVIVDAGIYWVHVTDDICKGADTIVVKSQKCYCIPSMPNAFTPNEDGKNDIFRAVFYEGCPISNYTLYIYNRWGQVVFNTSDIKQGWDGTFDGLPADIGTYMYTMQYTLGNEVSEVQRQHGDLTLIR